MPCEEQCERFASDGQRCVLRWRHADTCESAGVQLDEHVREWCARGRLMLAASRLDTLAGWIRTESLTWNDKTRIALALGELAQEMRAWTLTSAVAELARAMGATCRRCGDVAHGATCRRCGDTLALGGGS